MISKELESGKIRGNARSKSTINFVEADEFVRGTDLRGRYSMRARVHFAIASRASRTLRQGIRIIKQFSFLLFFFLNLSMLILGSATHARALCVERYANWYKSGL